MERSKSKKGELSTYSTNYNELRNFNYKYHICINKTNKEPFKIIKCKYDIVRILRTFFRRYTPLILAEWLRINNYGINFNFGNISLYVQILKRYTTSINHVLMPLKYYIFKCTFQNPLNTSYIQKLYQIQKKHFNTYSGTKR